MKCPNCRKSLQVSFQQIGKRIQCPGCELRFVLPDNSQLRQESKEKRVPKSLPKSEIPPSESSRSEELTVQGALIGSEEGHRRVEHRVREHGLIRMGLGASLLMLGLIATFFSPHFPLSLIATLACLAQGGRELYWGINAYTSFLIPEEFPADLQRQNDKGEDVVETLLLKHLISGTYMVPMGLLKKLAVAFVPRFRFLTPAQVPLFDTASSLGLASLAALPVIVIGMGLFGFHPLPLLAEATLIGGAAVAVLALGHCVPGERRPHESIIEKPDEKRHFTTGHLTDLVNHLSQDVFVDLREQGKFNRDLWTVPKLPLAADFEIVIGQETEPLLIDEMTDVPLSAPMLLERAGAGFVFGGWVFLLMIPSRLPFINGLVSLPAIAIGWWFVSLAFKLRNSYRFRSDLFRLQLRGSSTTRQVPNEILGVAGSEQREQLHTSNVYWMLHAATIISECSMAARIDERNIEPGEGARGSLRSPRYIIRVANDDKLRQRVDTIVNKLTQYEDVRQALDRTATKTSQENQQQKADLEHKLHEEKIRLEQQLRIEGENRLEQLRQQGRLQEMLLSKILEGMDPEELKRLARGEIAIPGLADASQRELCRLTVYSEPARSEEMPSLNARMLAALRRYLDKSNSAETRLDAKDEFDQLVADNNVADERVRELTRLVNEELQGC